MNFRGKLRGTDFSKHKGVEVDLNLRRKDLPKEFFRKRNYLFISSLISKTRDYSAISLTNGVETFLVKPIKGNEVFPFDKKSLLLRCVIRILCETSKEGGSDRKKEKDEFCCLFRIFFTLEETAQTGTNELSMKMISLKQTDNCVIRCLMDNIQFELWRRFPREIFKILSIKTQDGESIIQGNIFSYNFLFDIQGLQGDDFESGKTTIFIKAKRIRVSKRRQQAWGQYIAERKVMQFSKVELFQFSYHFLRKFKTSSQDLRFCCEQVIPLYYLNPFQFLKVSKQIILRIQREMGFKHDGEIPSRGGIRKVLGNLYSKNQTESSRDKVAPNEVGRLRYEFFLEFFTHMVSSALIQRDYFEALRLGIRGCSYVFEKNGLHQLAKSQFYSSFFKCKSTNPKEFRKIMIRGGKDIQPLINQSYDQIYKYKIIQILAGFREFPYNLHSLDSGMYLTLKCNHLSRSTKSEIFDWYTPTGNFDISREKGAFKIGNTVMRNDLTIHHSDIPMLFEIAFCKNMESFEKGFEIVYFVMFFAVIHHLKSGYFMSRNPLGSSELGIPMMYIAHRKFGERSDPFYLSPFTKMRVYDVLFNTFLKKTKRVRDYVIKNTTKQILPPKEIFYQISRLCWSRGRVILARKYIQLAREEDKQQECKLEYTRFQLEISLSIGEAGEKCRNSAKFPFLLALKGDGVNSVSNLFSSFIIDPREVLQILDRSGTISGEEEEEEGDGDRVHFFRIPSLFCRGIFFVVGGRVGEVERHSKKKKSNNISIFLREMSRKHQTTSKERTKLTKVEDGDLLDTMYILGIISFLERDFVQLKKWIILLTDLEFDRSSYESSPKFHLLFQVVSNLFHFEWRKRVRNLPNYLSLKPIEGEDKVESGVSESDEGKIYVVGDGQVLPFSHQSIKISGLPYRLIPMFLEGLRAVHLTDKSMNPRKECLLKRIREIVTQNAKHGKSVRIIFMIGELDLRSRILNDVVAESDILHSQFSETYQVELLSDILVRFVDSVQKEFRYGLRSVAICPIFPMMHVLEEKRMYNMNSMMYGCGNRIRMFNRSLEEKIVGEVRYEKNNLFYLGGGWEKMVLDKRSCDEEVKRSFDLGCGSYVIPGKDLLKKLQIILNKFFETCHLFHTNFSDLSKRL